VLPAGPCELRGRAWSGEGEIVDVEVSTDGGASWAAAELGDAALGPWAWRAWSFRWDADPGDHELCCRARDAAGNEQLLEAPWNVGGYMNNAVQRIAVTVTA
jgi:sulfane dehydrogenase subunit SoxC